MIRTSRSCVSITKGDTTYVLGAKLDLEAELVHSLAQADVLV